MWWATDRVINTVLCKHVGGSHIFGYGVVVVMDTRGGNSMEYIPQILVTPTVPQEPFPETSLPCLWSKPRETADLTGTVGAPPFPAQGTK